MICFYIKNNVMSLIQRKIILKDFGKSQIEIYNEICIFYKIIIHLNL